MKKSLLFILSAIAFQLQAQVYMYGTTYEGGENNLGTIYRVDENGQNFQKLFDFESATGGNPTAGLTLANDGQLYGFTTTNGQIASTGATMAFGTFYKFDPLTNIVTVVKYIDDKSDIGQEISHSPTNGADGLLYFTSAILELDSREGVLSSYDPSTATISVLDTFTTYYGQPKSKLLEASDGNLYITTNNGAEFGNGAVVKYDKALNSLVRLHSSPGGVGNYNNALNNPLFEASNGWVYGASQGGGSFNIGTVFMIAKDGTGYWQIDVMSSGISDEGYYPEGGFIEQNGILYSSTPQEEVVDVNSGTLYTVNTDGDQPSFIYTLDLEGARPKGTFTKSSNGRFYLTCEGGMLNSGSIIEYNPLNGHVTQRHLFSTNDGIKPLYDELCVVDFSALSINESSLVDNTVNTYPNPFQDIIYINSENFSIIETIKILDMSGSELYLDKPKSNQSTVNTYFLTSGFYLLYIQTDSGSTTRKIIKE
ncbi:choice-of-anchor tandem repeat GloVer-containing protein [Saccharicrinis aurantiacus]|uniref:choice-of-anchor tandem repeat GloVer-containing protein n=1 Tax=Saccharicrinis aurantiacus TaxID=1849719 RepID=UPI002493AA99|nr:choice-of-anchor tandem repeat GloVer-containing protein [Saccharicrinis aurantiacus]